MRFDIWSDVVCPWCYLGWRRFNKALEKVGGEDIEVVWHAYQLDPGAPEQAEPLRPSLERKYGPNSFDQMTGRLIGLGKEEGIEYNFEDAKSMNTLRAHELLAWAAENGKQSELMERIFHDYFTNGADMNNDKVLIDAATSVGLDGDMAGEVIASRSYKDAVAADIAQAQAVGISGVPAFVINQQFLISGAQETEQFVRAIEQMRSEGQ